MTEPNYKEFARKFYVAMKHQSHRNDIPQYQELMREYENLIKPKMEHISCIAGDKFVYDGKDYALIGRFWYRIQRSMLTFVEDDVLAEELIAAYSEWEKTK